jgi:hypothetical protein
MQKRFLALSILGSALPLLAGCQLLEKVMPKKEKAAEAEEAPKPSSSSSGPAAKAAEPPDPNDAFFTTGAKTNTLYRVRAGKVTKIDTGKCGNVDKIVVDKTGRAWVQCLMGVYRVDGDHATELDVVKRAKVVLGRDGSVWLTVGKPAAAHKLEGEAWKSVPLPDGLDVTWHLAVDAKGRPWASTKGAVYVREGDNWQPAPLDKDKPETKYPSKLVATDEGTVYVLNDKMKFVGIEDGKVTGRSFPNYQEPVPRPGGGVLVAGGGMGGTIQVLDAKGKQERTITPTGKVFFDAYATNTDRIAMDGQGRIWVGSKYGLVIIEADGNVTQWEPGRIEGVDGYIVDNVAVGGKGPDLPKLGEKVRGEVKGKIQTDKPVKVELCAGGVGFEQGGARSFYGPTPCSGKPLVRSATTDKDGNFHLKDVPPYGMSLLVQTTGTSWADRDPKCCLDLKPGEVRDVGTHQR